MTRSTAAEPERHAPRRTRLFLAGCAACVIAVVVAAVLVVAPGHDGSDGVDVSNSVPNTATVASEATEAGSVSSSSVPTPTSTTRQKLPAAVSPPPYTIVVAGDGRAVLLDSTNGEIAADLLAPEPGRIVYGAALSADSHVAYFSDFRQGNGATAADDVCEPRLYRKVIGRGSVEHIGDGVAPSPSPDGRYLAYVANGFRRGGIDGKADYCGLFAVVIRDLITGQERVSQPLADRPFRADEYTEIDAGELAWSADSRRVAYWAGYEGGWVFIYDVATDATSRVTLDPQLEHAAEVRFDGPPLISSPHWTAAGELLISIGCYACVRSGLMGVADDGFAVREFVLASSYPTIQRWLGWKLIYKPAAAGRLDVAVVSPAGEVTTIATQIRWAVWPVDARIEAPVRDRYPRTVPAVPSGHTLELRGQTLIATDPSGRSSVVVFEAFAALEELAVTADAAYVVEQAPNPRCLGTVWLLPKAGGSPIPLTDGRGLQPSPDGTLLAYGIGGTDPCPLRSAGQFEIVNPTSGRALGVYLSWPAAVVGPPTGLLWAGDSQSAVVGAVTGGRPALFLWRRDRSTAASPITVGGPARPNQDPLSHPELDRLYGAGQWGLTNPRFDHDVLVADVVCAAATRCGGLTPRAVRGGEDGIFYEIEN